MQSQQQQQKQQQKEQQSQQQFPRGNALRHWEKMLALGCKRGNTILRAQLLLQRW